MTVSDTIRIVRQEVWDALPSPAAGPKWRAFIFRVADALADALGSTDKVLWEWQEVCQNAVPSGSGGQRWGLFCDLELWRSEFDNPDRGPFLAPWQHHITSEMLLDEASARLSAAAVMVGSALLEAGAVKYAQ